MKVTGLSRAVVAAGHALDDETAVAYSTLCRRRLAGEPLQYIEGSVPFGGVELAVDPRVLIPRPETELLWEMIVTEVEKPALIVDLCTGSGALAVSLAHSFPGAEVWASELSSEAAQLAATNADANHVSVAVAIGDLFEPLPGRLQGSVDLFVSNPPYVSSNEFDLLPPDVRNWEPQIALVGGQTGLECIGRIAAELPIWIRSGGRFYIEIGETQGAEVGRMFTDGWADLAVRQDLAGKDRFVVGRAT